MTARVLPVLAVAAALLGPTGAAALASAPPPAGRVSATLGTCHQASDLAGRYATFAASMTAVPGSATMGIRFDLDERTPPDPGFHPVTGVPGFGVWTSSAPGVGIFGYTQEVSSLTAPGAFRVEVSFRWVGPRRRVLRRAHKVTPACVVALPPAGPAAGAPAPTQPSPPESTVVG
ncbi:MAG TPA: hypothetical protein VFR49_00610, partial [Solirubrobacteraceae bacterium]|nr:hypothetical protein [Solirubrobacteraceae bacterium]